MEEKVIDIATAYYQVGEPYSTLSYYTFTDLLIDYAQNFSEPDLFFMAILFYSPLMPECKITIGPWLFLTKIQD